MRVKIFITILLILIAIVCVYVFFIERTPQKILEQQFSFNIQQFDYSIKTFDEQWDYNGDGYCLIEFRIDKISKEDIDYIKSFRMKKLPVFIQLPSNKLTSKLGFLKNGYYLHQQMSPSDVRDFKLLIIDMANKKIILYYQIE